MPWNKLPIFRKVLAMAAPRVVKGTRPCQEVIEEGRGCRPSGKLPVQDLLAWRRRPADYLGADHHQGAPNKRAAETSGSIVSR